MASGQNVVLVYQNARTEVLVMVVFGRLTGRPFGCIATESNIEARRPSQVVLVHDGAVLDSVAGAAGEFIGIITGRVDHFTGTQAFRYIGRFIRFDETNEGNQNRDPLHRPFCLSKLTGHLVPGSGEEK